MENEVAEVQRKLTRLITQITRIEKNDTRVVKLPGQETKEVP